ncbi:hypothetical protein E2542_SST28243 [Spatholobus suberectus]|nr:hypothetical protein E2542_SST28243 [Spatholobus suberectus]
MVGHGGSMMVGHGGKVAVGSGHGWCDKRSGNAGELVFPPDDDACSDALIAVQGNGGLCLNLEKKRKRKCADTRFQFFGNKIKTSLNTTTFKEKHQRSRPSTKQPYLEKQFKELCFLPEFHSHKL